MGHIFNTDGAGRPRDTRREGKYERMRQPPFLGQPLSKKNRVGGPEKGHNAQHHVSSAGGFLHSFRVSKIQ